MHTIPSLMTQNSPAPCGGWSKIRNGPVAELGPRQGRSTLSQWGSSEGSGRMLVAGLIGIISAAIGTVGSIRRRADGGSSDADRHATTNGRTAVVKLTHGAKTASCPFLHR